MVEELVDLIMIGGDPVAAVPAAGGADQYAALTKQVYLEPELTVIDIKTRAVQLRQQARASDDVLPANVKRQHPQESTFRLYQVRIGIPQVAHLINFGTPVADMQRNRQGMLIVFDRLLKLIQVSIGKHHAGFCAFCHNVDFDCVILYNSIRKFNMSSQFTLQAGSSSFRGLTTKQLSL